MSLLDEAEGRVVTLMFKVRLSPPKNTPVGDETNGAQKVAEELLKTGSAKLKEVVASQGYSVEVSTAYFIY